MGILFLHTIMSIMNAVLALVLAFAASAWGQAEVRTSKKLFPPRLNEYHDVKDAGDAWIVETSTFNTDKGKVLLLDGRTLRLNRCEFKSKSYLGGLQLRYKTKVVCKGYPEVEHNSGSKSGSRAKAICDAARLLTDRYGNGQVEVWFGPNKKRKYHKC